MFLIFAILGGISTPVLLSLGYYLAWKNLGDQPDSEQLRRQLFVGSNLNWGLCSKLSAFLIVAGLTLGLLATISAIVAVV
jgi:hypothetical protein